MTATGRNLAPRSWIKGVSIHDTKMMISDFYVALTVVGSMMKDFRGANDHLMSCFCPDSTRARIT